MTMERKRIVVAGTNFAGYTAALELKEMLGDQHDITVVSPTHKFLFYPSLIWFPFGIRDEKDITFDVRPIYQSHNIKFIETRATRFDLDNRKVLLEQGEPLEYDYLVIATGFAVDYDYVPGLREHAYSIVGIKEATRTREAWQKFLQSPGPAVVVSVQGTGCFGAAYEFLFNMRYQIAKHHLKKETTLTYVTAEPYPAHFGIGGFGNAKKMCEMLFKFYRIESRFNVSVKEFCPDGVTLETGEKIPSTFTVAVPRFIGSECVRNTPGLGNAMGFIEVGGDYRHPKYPEVYAVGAAVEVKPPEQTEKPCGVPKTGYPSEQMAKIAAKNIVADIKKLPKRYEQSFAEMNALCIMDTGNMGMMIAGDHMLPPREHEFIIPGPEAHWAKVAFEKYFMFTRKRAIV
ncbi:MAG: FAD-dependent oxidoreductase [Chloroherpetonaceae bacterium]|nr:FAD-dependent oxidoreductase [Chloroherpetonaceae bacterium]